MFHYIARTALALSPFPLRHLFLPHPLTGLRWVGQSHFLGADSGTMWPCVHSHLESKTLLVDYSNVGTVYDVFLT